MPRIALSAALSAALVVSACSGDSDPGPTDLGSATDSGAPPERDGGVSPAEDGGAEVDGGVAVPDAGAEADGGSPGLTPELAPGAHVQVAEGRVTVMSETFADVVDLLGPGTRTAQMNARSYEWSLSDGVELTVWFANSNLDDDDGAPNDVDDTDTVLWIAVRGGFTGETPGGIGLGATRAEVEGAYGVAPNESPLTNPSPGTLAQYYTTGLLVAYEPDDTVRTITVSRAYDQAPDGEIDVDSGRLRFGGTDIEGGLFGGTSDSAVENLLGTPDAQGDISVSGRTFRTLSYGFIGIEIFLGSADDVVFLNVHAPYYGLTPGDVGVGTDRAVFEAWLSSQGYDGGTASSGNAQFICYSGPEDVGVTYSADDDRVTSITTPLLQCP